MIAKEYIHPCFGSFRREKPRVALQGNSRGRRLTFFFRHFFSQPQTTQREMGRNYAKELRDRGIVVHGNSQSPAWRAWYAWIDMDPRQRAAFCARAGLMPI